MIWLVGLALIFGAGEVAHAIDHLTDAVRTCTAPVDNP